MKLVSVLVVILTRFNIGVVRQLPKEAFEEEIVLQGERIPRGFDLEGRFRSSLALSQQPDFLSPLISLLPLLVGEDIVHLHSGVQTLSKPTLLATLPRG